MFCLLTDEIFRAQLKSGAVRLSLPGLFAAMMTDDVVDLPSVRPHQRQALMAFLAQLGALALHQAGRVDPPADAGQWTELLRGLTPEFPANEPWTLIVGDISKPALLQPPIPEGKIDILKEREETPDALDMLVTSKNHDLKAARLWRATPEHWFLALLTLQTMEGFLGAGNYGIARMNGGFASRPMVGLAPSGGMGAHLRRDIAALGVAREEILDRYDYRPKGGKALLWLDPWDGKTPLKQRELDPYFIEICRRVRLISERGRIIARRVTTAAARIHSDKNAGGVTGDPWAPIGKGKATKVLTIDGRGFNYKRVTDLLDAGAFEAAPLQRRRENDAVKGLSLHFLATARGQGGTDGFHERRIRVPAGWDYQEADPLATLARESVEEVGKASRMSLKWALYVLFQNAPDKVNMRHPASESKARAFLDAFDGEVDRVFFDLLMERLNTGDDAEKRNAARKKWLRTLYGLGKAQLTAAEDATPRSGLRRHLAISAARGALEAGFLKAFEEWKELRP